MDFPTPSVLHREYLNVLNSDGPSMHIDVCKRVATNLNLSKEQLELMQDERRKKFDFRMAWAKSGLKDKGLISVSGKVVSITDLGRDYLSSK